jgi:tetratricopeptide (TPR) repeat protein
MCVPNLDSIAALRLRLELEQQFEQVDRYRLAQDHFIIARDYERRGMDEMAGRMYEIAFEFWPESRFLRKTLLDRYMRTEEYKKALSLFREDDNLAELTAEEKRTISLIYLRLGNIAKAAEAVEALGEAKSDDEIYSLGLLYESIGDRARALGSFREFFNRNPRSAAMGTRIVRFNLGERKFAEAESLAVILRHAYPQNADVAALLGTVKHLQRDTAAAIKHFNEALAIDSLNEEALRTLAHIHLMRYEYTEAAAFYKRLIAQGEVGAIYRRGLALLLFHKKDFEESEKLLDTLISEKDNTDLPGRQELYLYRGLIYSQTNRRDKAAADMRSALAIDPKFEDAWKELCYIHILAKEADKAYEVVEEYAAAFPEAGSAWRFRGYVFNMQKRSEDAIAALRKAVEIDANDYFAWFELGNTLEKYRRREEAAEAFQAVLRIRPGDPVASNNLGYVWTEMGINLDSAKVLIEIALKKDPHNGAFLDSYAWVFYKMGDYEKALHYMNEALKQSDMKNEPIAYEHLGDIQFKRKDYAAAEKAYNRAIELKTEDAERIKGRLKEVRELMRKKER